MSVGQTPERLLSSPRSQEDVLILEFVGCPQPWAEWVSSPGATYSGGTIRWNLCLVPSGSFQVSSKKLYQYMTFSINLDVESTLILCIVSIGDLSAMGCRPVSVNCNYLPKRRRLIANRSQTCRRIFGDQSPIGRRLIPNNLWNLSPTDRRPIADWSAILSWLKMQMQRSQWNQSPRRRIAVSLSGLMLLKETVIVTESADHIL